MPEQPFADIRDLQRVVAFSDRAKSLPDYSALIAGFQAPELPDDASPSIALAAVQDLFLNWGLDRGNRGTAKWNPLGHLIPSRSRVVIKPNWVYHAARGPATLDCLVTHTSIILAVLEYVALTRPASVVIGDAPVQGCDFEQLRHSAGFDLLSKLGRERNLPVEIVDFRRTVNPGGHAGGRRISDARTLDKFVLFDLADRSALQPLDADSEKFRVTVYDPDLMRAVHHRGSHQYLVAKEVIDADIVINMPKLKCHRKACITGTLKNLIGINGHKEYLPHHRKGGTKEGGDCYPGSPVWKTVLENLSDTANRDGTARSLRYGLGRIIAATQKLAGVAGLDDNLEGSWYGNDTVWRTCIDLNRILMYGAGDGRLRPAVQRTIINITDGIIAGEGEGPLLPSPVAAGFITGSLSAAAADYVHAGLMGFDPERIPITREAFRTSDIPLADFSPRDILFRNRAGEVSAAEVRGVKDFTPPKGWIGHCEQESEYAPVETNLAGV